MEAAVPEAATKQRDNVAEHPPPRAGGLKYRAALTFQAPPSSGTFHLPGHSPSLDAFLRSQASPMTGEHEAVGISSFIEDLFTFTDYYLGLVQAATVWPC